MRLPIAAAAPVLLAALVAGCAPRESTHYQLDAEGPASATAPSMAAAPAEQRPIVLFAPLALGPLAEIIPAARDEWPSDLADRVTWNTRIDGRPHAGRHNRHLPASDAADWSRGRVPGTRTVKLVVLTQVLEVGERLGEATAQGRARYATATVEMRAIDAEGTLVFRKRGQGEAEAKDSPKFLGPANDARVKAAWQATTAVLGALLAHQAVTADGAPADSVAGVVPVRITSDPPGADVVVDGIYRGATPLELKLPARAVELLIERPGYLPWKRTVLPNANEPVHRELIRADSQK